MEQDRLTSEDFFTGLLAALAVRGRGLLSIRDDRFDRAVEAAFSEISDPKHRLNVRFRIRRHALHGDSAKVRDSITKAAQRDLISLDNPEYQDIRLKISADDGEKIIRTLPGGETLYATVANTFLDVYEDATEEEEATV